MNQPRRLHRSMLSLLSLTLLLGAAIPLPAAAGGQGQGGGQHEHHAMSPEQSAPQGESMMGDSAGMMGAGKQMMAERQAMDAKLDELLAAVHGASGPAKVDAMEAVLDELVAQRRAMSEMMTGHHDAMMQHMGEGGMGDCPMMKKGMMPQGESGESADEHSAHHAEEGSAQPR